VPTGMGPGLGRRDPPGPGRRRPPVTTVASPRTATAPRTASSRRSSGSVARRA
jgi:hypothetical protein